MEGISVEQAVEQILQHTPVINETEETELNKAGGRVLAQDMVDSCSPVSGLISEMCHYHYGYQSLS